MVVILDQTYDSCVIALGKVSNVEPDLLTADKKCYSDQYYDDITTVPKIDSIKD